MISKYGDFNEEQLNDYRERLHNKLFWLLLYKDPDTKEDFSYVDFGAYFNTLMLELNGLNTLLLYPHGLPELLSTLQAAYEESERTPFHYRVYRKLVLDSHALLDRLNWEDEKNDRSS